MLVESPSPTLCVGPEGKGGGGSTTLSNAPMHPYQRVALPTPQRGGSHTLERRREGRGGVWTRGEGGRGGGGGSTLTNFGTVGTGIFFCSCVTVDKIPLSIVGFRWLLPFPCGLWMVIVSFWWALDACCCCRVGSGSFMVGSGRLVREEPSSLSTDIAVHGQLKAIKPIRSCQQ